MKRPHNRFTSLPRGVRVDYLALWRHRWVLLNILNQVSAGTHKDACFVVERYGGSFSVADDLFDAAREVIRRDNEEASQ